MTHLKIGDLAPSFLEFNQNGKNLSLLDYKDKNLILYFYPKDNTPGCTAESCNLNENYAVLTKNGFAVLGVSPDTQISHQKFINKYALSFNLIADTQKKICKDYGVWSEKNSWEKHI